MKVLFKKMHDDTILPAYQRPGDAGMDLHARELRTLDEGDRHVFKLGFATSFPPGYVAMLCDRSSMAARGITVLGGIIDSGYRGEWMVVLVNTGTVPYTIHAGDRIAQVLFLPVEHATPVETSELDETQRGLGGFGTTGR